MGPGFDWSQFVKHHWEKSPARLPFRAPALSAEHIFRNATAVCDPFRHGTRFRALPDARFFVGHARLAAPGPLLPGVDDASLGAYLDRAATQLRGAPFQLHIEQPFMFDFALWSAVREVLRGLMERVGVPVLPATTDLVLGRFDRGALGVSKRPHHALLLLVVQGRLRVRIWKKLWGAPANETLDFNRHLDEATTLEARAGDLVYVPSHCWQLEEAPDECMAVRVWLPVKGSRPTDVVKNVLVSQLEGQHARDEAVPYLAYPWRRPRKGARASVEGLEQTADALHALTRDVEVHQRLRLIWARRVSACALEPVPPPDTPAPLAAHQRVRLAPSADLIRMKDPSGLWIWAVNGHAFPGPGDAVARRLLQALSTEEACSVGTLCGQARTVTQRDGIRALLETLLRLRGLQLVSGAEG
ncbi:hypothetical protein [Myxococcus sp. Y35]|uniref:hypothetical protein n=1 Tax=Pseudomyxococcus flavus TaxID=3115648 RepID=UPI003CEA5850